MAVEVRPEFGRACPASLTHEQRFKIGQADVTEPAITADRDRMAAIVMEQ
jgi:hypothetical protein